MHENGRYFFQKFCGKNIHLASQNTGFSFYWGKNWKDFALKKVCIVIVLPKDFYQASPFKKVPSMSFYPDFILILSWFYPDFILILSWFYLDFIQILSRFFKNSLYPNFIQILSWFYPDIFKNQDKIRIKFG